MAIRRAARPENHFTQIRNDVLRDVRLSFRARGILATILSYPDDWMTSSEALARAGTEGRDAVRTALSELETHGYLRREKAQDDRGRWATQAVIYDAPQAVQGDLLATDDGFPGVGSPVVGFPGANRTLSTNTSPKGEAAGAAVVPAEASKPEAAPPDKVAKAVYDHAKGMVKYMGLRQVALRALNLEGQTEETVTAAMVAVYDMGKPVTLTTVGQHLKGRRRQDDAHTNHWAQPGAGF